MPDSYFSADVPAAPPPEVMAEVDAAWQRSADFGGDDLGVHLRVGKITGRVSGELRCEDAVLARLAPSQLLALACGDPLPLPRARR